MAYAIKYTASFKNRTQSSTFKIDILQDGFVGTAETITYMGATPIFLNYKSEKDKEQIIQASSLTFNFMSLEADSNKYDAIFEGDLKEFKVNYYKDASLIWTGYLQSDNFQRNYFNNLYEIQLNATDWIANLKDVEYRESAGEASILAVIKECLSYTGIELDFEVQLNTYETNYLTSISSILENIFINRSRFVKISSGKTEYKKVYDVLENLLKPLNLTFKQTGGKYYISNIYEIDSFYFAYDWATLTPGTRTASSNILDISAYNFDRSGTATKLKPKRYFDIIRKAKDLGGSLISGLDDFASASPWTKSVPDGYTTGTGYINMNYIASTTYISATTGSEAAQDNKYLKVKFGVTFDYLAGPELGYLKIIIIKPDASEYTQEYTTKTAGSMVLFESEISDNYLIDQTGAYTVKIDCSITNGDGVTTTVIKIQDVEINSMLTTSSTYDENYFAYTDFTEQKEEQELIFADATSSTDQGGLKCYSGGSYVRTTSWSRYGKTDNKTIQEIYALNLLKNRQDYKDYLQIVAFDDNLNITAKNIIQIDSDYYRILEIDTNYKLAAHKLQIEKLLTTDPTYNFTTSELTSIDGQDTVNENPIGGDFAATDIRYARLGAANEFDDYLNHFKGNVTGAKDIVAFADSTYDPSLWDGMPIATTSSIGGFQIDSAGRFSIDTNDTLQFDDSGLGDQTLSFSNPNLSISSGNSVDLSGLTPDLSSYADTGLTNVSRYAVVKRTVSQPSINSTGWKRIFRLDGGNGKGAYNLSIQMEGGAVIPLSQHLSFSKQWTTGLTLLSYVGDTAYFNSFRITEDTDGLNYVELYCNNASIAANVVFSIMSMSGYAAATAVVADGSEAAVGTGTVQGTTFTLGVYWKTGQNIYGNNIIATGEVTAYSSSDKKLKKNIKPLKTGLEIINKLKPIFFNWKKKAVKLSGWKNTKDIESGLIAQDVEKLIPEAVGSVHEKYKGIKYEKLVPYLIDAIQELTERIEVLEQKNIADNQHVI